MDHREFERQIKEYIREDGRSQAAVAKKLGYTRDTFNKWVRFVNRMPDTVIVEFCNLLGLDSTQCAELLKLAGYAAPPTPTPPAKMTVSPPLQRPQQAVHFVGREAALAQLIDALQPGNVVTLCGPGGIGKTALAAQAVWSLAPDGIPPAQFPDGILFHSFYNQPETSLALEAFVRSYGDEPQPTPEAAARRVLAGKRALLILDGAEDADDLARVLAVRDGCAVLITSRQRKDALAQWQMLEPLPMDDATMLLRAWGGAWATDEKAVRRLCDLVGGLPLAVRLAGRFLAQQGWHVGDYLAWLEQTPLAALNQGRRREESVPLLLRRSVEQVSRDAQAGLAVIGRLASAPFDAVLLGKGLDCETLRAKRVLGELVNLGLLLTDGETYEVSHALVHTFAGDALAVDFACIQRVVEHLTAEMARPNAAREQLGTTRNHVTALMGVALEQKAWSLANKLATAAEQPYHLQGFWSDLLNFAESGLEAARRLGDKAAMGDHLFWLGVVHCNQGHYALAVDACRQALDVAREAERADKEVDILSQLGFIYSQMARHDEAIECQQRAWQMARSLNDRHVEAMTLNHLGVAYIYPGRFREALIYLEKALALFEMLGNQENQCTVLHNLGDSYRCLGAHETAIEVYERCLAMRARTGYRSFEGSTLSGLGRSLQEIGLHDAALARHTAALNAVRSVGDRRNEGVALINLGCTYNALARYDEAAAALEQAHRIATEIGDRHNGSISLVHLAETWRETAQYARSHLALTEALAIAQETHDPGVAGHAAEAMARLLRAQGDLHGALYWITRGLSIAEPNALHARWASLLCEASVVYQELGRFGPALEALDQALEILADISEHQVRAVEAQRATLIAGTGL